MKKEWCCKELTRIEQPMYTVRRKWSYTDEPVLTLNKKLRCHKCGRRLNIVLIGCQCCTPQVFGAFLPPHKRRK